MTTTRSARVNGGIISFSTEVEIDECVDVDVRLKLDDVIDELIESLTAEQSNEIASKAGLMKPNNYHGDELKRHICDILYLGYHTSKEDILIELNKLL